MTRLAMLSVSIAAMLSGCAMPGNREPLSGRVIPCPCDLDELGTLPDAHPNVVISRDSDRATARYHPGSFVTYRIFDPATDPVAGNQCAFDDEGKLISTGPAAGTPDFVSPERSILGHWVVDVLPFRRLGWMEYHRRGWGPISRASCE